MQAIITGIPRLIGFIMRSGITMLHLLGLVQVFIDFWDTFNAGYSDFPPQPAVAVMAISRG